MAVTAESSTQYLKQTDPRTYGRLDPEDTPQKMRPYEFTFTQGAAAGDAGSTANLVYLQPGRYKIYWQLSRFECSAFGAARVMDVGYSAYTRDDGVAVVADDNVADDNVDISAAITAALGSDILAAGTGGVTELKVGAGGVTILATVAGGTIPAAATLKGYLMIAEVGA